MKLIPLNDKVLVLPDPVETKTPGGIIIPGTAENRPTKGTVIAVGPKANGDPTRVDPLLAPPAPLVTGAKVMFPLYGGVEVEIDDAKHRLIPAEEILGVIVPE